MPMCQCANVPIEYNSLIKELKRKILKVAQFAHWHIGTFSHYRPPPGLRGPPPPPPWGERRRAPPGPLGPRPGPPWPP
jgi:hypothetical protein